jgi:hypothetical protein
LNLIAAAQDIKKSYFYMVANLKLLHPDDQIEMPDMNIIVNPAFLRVDDAQSNTDALADFVTKKKPIAGALEKRRQQRNQCEYNQPGLAQTLHVLLKSLAQPDIHVNTRAQSITDPIYKSGRAVLNRFAEGQRAGLR